MLKLRQNRKNYFFVHSEVQVDLYDKTNVIFFGSVFEITVKNFCLFAFR